MKKYIPVFILMLCFTQADAQYFPLRFMHDIRSPYYGSPTSCYKQTCFTDSIFYAIRYGAVQRYDLRTDSASYDWKGTYQASKITSNKSGDLLLLKGTNSANQLLLYTHGNTAPVDITYHWSTSYIYDIAFSTNKIWVLMQDSLAVYDGTNWQVSRLALYPNYNLSLLPSDDSSAYISNSYVVYHYTHTSLDSVYTFPSPYSFQSWDADVSGNAWIANINNFIKISPTGTVAIFDTSNVVTQNYEEFRNIATTPNGDIWMTGNGNLYRYHNGVLSLSAPYYYSTLTYFCSDPAIDRVWYISGDSIRTANSSGYSTYGYIGNAPYQSITGIGREYIGTKDGLMTYYPSGISPLSPTSFIGTTSYHPYADDATCFLVPGDYYNFNFNDLYAYGTHHGVYGSPYLSSSALPDSVINYIYEYNSSYYIGTNKGLCIYNQILYTTFDTSNSPLPSNKITFITSAQSYYNNQNTTTLYVGTDKGIATYRAGQWSVWDTAALHIPSFYVTGIKPPQVSYGIDSSMWVTTLGTGLVLINNNGSYKIYNSANGHMKDDSLYYVARYTLAECEQGLVIGTNSKGVAHLVYPDTFTYITSMYDKQSGGKTAYNIKKSAYYVSTSNYIILVTDNGFFFGSACGSIKETSNTTAPINWTQDGDKLSLLMPEDKKWEASMYDLTGRLVSTLKEATPTNTAIWDISNIGTGFYIIKADDNKEVLTTKIWVEK